MPDKRIYRKSGFDTQLIRHWRMAHLRANTSAAKTKGLIVRALRIWRSTTASRKPADRNSPRKASPSLAPAIHANQSLSLALTSGGAGFDRINSAT
jgi:hypothetical protein